MAPAGCYRGDVTRCLRHRHRAEGDLDKPVAPLTVKVREQVRWFLYRKNLDEAALPTPTPPRPTHTLGRTGL